jgi:hypothetical protein
MAEQRAFQTILKNGSTVIGNLLSVGFPGMTLDVKQTTHHGLSDPYHTKRGTIGDPGTITAKVQMTSAQFATLWGYFDPAANPTTWSITYPFGTPIVVSCSGFLSRIGIPDAEVDGILEVEIEITLSGKPSVT